jgi:hypothetical protein
MSTSRLKLVRPEVSDEALIALALDLEDQHEEKSQLLYAAVLTDDWGTAKKLAKELRDES